MSATVSEVGDLPCLLKVLSECLVVDGQAGDVRRGEVEVLLELVVSTAKFGVAGDQPRVFGAGCSVDVCGWRGAPDFSEFFHDLGVVAAKGRVGQPELAGERQDAGSSPVTVGLLD
ncbi:hypothetical protein OG225_41745 (plasmid) [Nocardia sp. NBC_01377]|uniref:hypothetical protein n=1 Tax=Nocardia sp. NBC_01377 TaxID=2903595 RepID=UPI00324974BE